MKESWLVQRLNPPHRQPGPRGDFAAAFAFGGGLKNGGLSGEAMDLLRDCFSFDYMGAAEFEWGAVPEALSGIAKAKDLTAFEFPVALNLVPAGWRDEGGGVPDGNATIFVICRRDDSDAVSQRIIGWATETRERLKEWTRLAEVLRPSGDYVPRTCGWLELDNGFFFFIDRVMFERVCALFSVSVVA